MRKAVGAITGLCLMLLPTIGSSGTDTMKPGANHPDRALYMTRARKVDLRAVDRSVGEAVITIDEDRAPPR